MFLEVNVIDMKKIIALVIPLLSLVGCLNAQIKYLPNSEKKIFDQLKYKLKLPSNSLAENYLIEIINNDTALIYNHPRMITTGAGYPITLCKDSLNFYDSRILGTWISENGKYMDVFCKIPNGNGILYKRYTYSSQFKKYFQDWEHILRLTNFDSCYFMETDFSIDYKGKKTQGYPSVFYPFRYTFQSNDDLVFSRISRRYNYVNPDTIVGIGHFTSVNFKYPDSSKLLTFNSTAELRNFIKSSMLKEDFFNDGFHMRRFTGNFSKYDWEKKDEVKSAMEGALAILLLATILGSDDSTVPTAEPIQKHILGYDKQGNAIYDSGVSTNKIYYDSNMKPIN